MKPLAFTLLLLLLIAPAYAHEIYVLNQTAIDEGLAAPGTNPLTIIGEHIGSFALWASIGAAVVLLLILLSASRMLQRKTGPFLMWLKRYAPLAARITLGVCMIFNGFYGALFGPELPLVDIFGSAAPLWSILFVISGILITIGLFARYASIVPLIAFLAMFVQYGTYSLTYINYLGEIVLVMILGSGAYSVDSRIFKQKESRLEEWAFPTLRVLFGISLIYASVYAKLIFSNLALSTVVEYGLDQYFPFDPMFIVLGAMIVEIILGVFYIIGVDIRFTSVFLMTFLTMSLVFFGETVWPHYVIYGVAIALLLHGYDKYTLESWLFKRWRMRGEPAF